MSYPEALHRHLVTEVEDAIERTKSFPGSWYADPEIAAVEKAHVIRRTWQPIGPIDELKTAGDFLTCDVAEAPVLVVRQTDGGVKAFGNMCGHRGHPVAKDSGHVPRGFVCPYHAWSYGIDGTLLNAVRGELEKNFDPWCHSLKPVRVGVWGEMAFVNLVAEGPSFEDDLGELMSLADAEAIGLRTWHYHKTLRWEQACNWKVFMDNTADSYHTAVVHPHMTGTHKIDPEDYITRSYSNFAFHTPLSLGGEANMPPWKACGAWPNWTVQGMESSVSTLRIIEMVDAGNIRVKVDFFAPEGASDEDVEQAAHWNYNLVHGEDKPGV